MCWTSKVTVMITVLFILKYSDKGLLYLTLLDFWTLCIKYDIA